MAFLQNFSDLQDFVFWYWAQNKKPETTENLYFWIYKVQMHVDLFFNHYFDILSVKTEINNDNNNIKRKANKKRQTQFSKSRGVRIS